MRQRRGRLTLREQPANRLACIKGEARDVHQSHDIRSIRTKRCDDLTAIGMSGNKGRAGLRYQHLPKPCDIVPECSQWKLRRRNVVTRLLQEPDDAAPTGTVRPGSMHQDNVRLLTHWSFLPCLDRHAHPVRLPEPHNTDCPSGLTMLAQSRTERRVSRQ